MDRILTTNEFLLLLEKLKLKTTRQNLLISGIPKAYSHPKFTLWDVDVAVAFCFKKAKMKGIELDREDVENVVKFIQDKRNGAN